MKKKRKPSVVSIIFPILLASMILMIIACEWTISVSSNELKSRALETCQAEIGYISDALYSQLTDIQMQNVDILNNESVLALAMRSSILDRYETVSIESTVMKLIRSRLSQMSLDVSAQLYIPSIHTVITPQKAAAATTEELEGMMEIIRNFPKGLYYTDESMGFWSAYPLIYDVSMAEESRIMLTGIRRDSLRSLLRKYASYPNDYQLFLEFGDQVIASSHDTDWGEGIFRELGGKTDTIKQDDREYYVILAQHTYSSLSITAILPVDSVMQNMYSHRRLLRTLESVCVLIVLLSAAAFYHVVLKPLKGISGKMQEIGDGDLSVRIIPEKTRELNDVASTFNQMAERLQDQIDREYKTRLLAADAEKKALQYQISPHFLYNTYFQLRNLILLEENEQAQRLADLMGRYLRYIVHQDGSSTSLGEEMDHARNYAEIQSMRFRGRIEVRCSVPDGDWRALTVPRMLVQPLIENAFNHGLKDVETDGMIWLTLRQTEKMVTITVEDNGAGLSEPALEALRRSIMNGQTEGNEGVALANIHRRLQLHYGLQSGLLFEMSETGGLKVIIRIRDGKERT